MAKFGALFCVLLLAYGAQCSLIANIGVDIDLIVGMAKESIANVTTSFEEAIASVQQAATEAAENVSSTVNDVVQKYQDAIASTVESAIQNIDTCTQIVEAQIATATANTQAEATACATNVTDQLASQISDVTTQWTAASNYIELVIENATACQQIWKDNQTPVGWFKAMACISDLATTATTEFPGLTEELTETVTRFASYTVNLRDQLKRCANWVATTAFEEALQAAYDSFDECAATINETS